jgi:hypothetical protein
LTNRDIASDPVSIKLLDPARHIGCEAHAVGGVIASQAPHHLVPFRKPGVRLRRDRFVAAIAGSPAALLGPQHRARRTTVLQGAVHMVIFAAFLLWCAEADPPECRALQQPDAATDRIACWD